ncbi:MAG: dephospho-CoA kinase [Anaerococcus sp.]|uniref:dephospho-CoA kinase n=1 Tax=Anaerococcus sp. TaxID=1872515 RepID=UPI0029152411|nr:dephospho-CoA kinase [Anaerococcus sp.]MDU7411686.1 dephospho-CoA kinase [Anaerococcus sp.]
MSPSKIVITGTIASGKSTLCKLLESKGFIVISADEVNKSLLNPGAINYESIKKSGEFDKAFINESLDKEKLGQIIFSDENKLKKLNKITHRNILNEIKKQIDLIDEKAVFVEIPLYFQMEVKFDADEVWLVVADYETQIKRLMNRDNINLSYAKVKIESQRKLINMKEKSDVVFDNSTSVENLNEKLEEILVQKDLL